MSLKPRPEVEALKNCPHGGLNYAELKTLGLAPEAMIDFSASTNPFMPPPGVRKILRTVAINQYPDSGSTEFRERLSEKLGIAPDSIIAGSGTTELIRLIALTYFEPGDPVMVLGPTFGEYELAIRIAGSLPIKQLAREEDGLALKLDDTTDFIKQSHPKAVFICNPNNPTGKYLSRSEVEALLGATADSLLVIDEAYITFVGTSWTSLDLITKGNVVILRSMTKDYGLAGLRLGYAIASPEIIASLRRVCPPWNVNSIAQKVGVYCLEQADYLQESQRKLREARKLLIEGLTRLGFPPLPSEANFCLVRVGNARLFRAALLKHSIIVRDCASFGLPEYIRIAPRTLPDCHKLLRAIRLVKQKGELT